MPRGDPRKMISMRVGPEHLAAIDAAAEQEGTDRTTYMVEAALGRAEGRLRPVTATVWRERMKDPQAVERQAKLNADKARAARRRRT